MEVKKEKKKKTEDDRQEKKYQPKQEEQPVKKQEESLPDTQQIMNKLQNTFKNVNMYNLLSNE